MRHCCGTRYILCGLALFQCGWRADPAGRAGQLSQPATHLIKIAVEAACGKRQGLIFLAWIIQPRMAPVSVIISILLIWSAAHMRASIIFWRVVHHLLPIALWAWRIGARCCFGGEKGGRFVTLVPAKAGGAGDAASISSQLNPSSAGFGLATTT